MWGQDGILRACRRQALLVMMVVRVIMSMSVQLVAVIRYHAAGIRDRAAHVLELHRVVVQVKAFPQQTVQLVQNPLAL